MLGSLCGLLVLLLSAAVLAAPGASAATTRNVYPGQSWRAAIAASSPGDTVVVHAGTYGPQLVDNVHKSSPGVRVVGESRTGVLVQGLRLKASSGMSFSTMSATNTSTAQYGAVTTMNGTSSVSFSDITVQPVKLAGFDVASGSRSISISGSTIDGSRVTGAEAVKETSRGIRVNGSPYDAASWVDGLTIRGNTISGAGCDLIQIAGGRNVTISDNTFRSPQANGNHNDGIQSFGSDGLVISGNSFTAPGPNGPDQAIILGNHPTESRLRVTNTTVVNNLIFQWRGTGILVAGTSGTSIYNNTSVDNGTAASPGAGFASEAPGSFTNSDLRLWRNVFDKITRDAPITEEVGNCVRDGGRGTGLVTADPLFRSDVVGYQLSAASPCRNVVTSLQAPGIDFGDRKRDDGKPDAGAWEVQ